MGRLLLGLRQERHDGLYGGWEEKVCEKKSVMERAEACAQEEVG